ncbi:MAG: ABC transporter substrate-binding protein [Actinomycetota bacterium]
MAANAYRRGRFRLATNWLAMLGALTLLASGCGARWSPDQELRVSADKQQGLTGESAPDAALEPGTSSTVGDTGGAISSLSGGGLSGNSSTPSGARSTGPTGSASRVDAGPHPGVTDTEITLCVLVPLTGAAPIPTNWKDGANLYWDHLRERGGVHGRNVKLNIKDTKSDTATALAEARNCISEQSFTFLTFDRTAIGATVSKFLNGKGIPNVIVQGPATPDMDTGSDQVNTFAINIDHREQPRIVAEYFTTGDLASKRERVGIVRENNPDAERDVEVAKPWFSQKGIKVVVEEVIDEQGNDYTANVLRLMNAKAELVWFDGAPTPMIKLAQQAFAAGYHPTWFGYSVSWSFETVAQIGNANGAMNGARAFSSWVALSSPAAGTYKAAYRETYPNQTPDDIGLMGWAFGEVMHAGLQAAGRQLGYNTFRSAFQSLDVTPQTWAPLHFGPGVRVGTHSIVEFRIDGTHWDQVGTFRSAF